MKIEELIAEQEDLLDRSQGECESILARAKQRASGNLTADEQKRSDDLFIEIKKANRKLEQFREIKAEEDAIDARASQVVPTGAVPQQRTGTVRVTREERTYHQGTDEAQGFRNQPGGAFLLDIVRREQGDPLASDRLSRHMREEYVERPWLEQRSSSTASFTGLVIPQYLADEAAPAVAAARPLADVMSAHTLPEIGMSVNLSRITTPTAGGVQASQNTNLANQDIADTLLTIPVQTAGGYVQLSRQAVERGVLTEDITTTDLLMRVAVALETQIIGQATTGLAAAATSQAYVNATVDTTAVPTFLRQLPAAQSAIDTALLSRTRPAYVIMHPRRFNWLTAATSSTWPIMSGVATPTQSNGLQLTNDYGPAVRAVMPNGMKIVVDGNVTTVGLGTALTGGTQDHVYAISAQESYLYEPPQRAVMIRAEQPQAPQLGILFVAYEYFAFSFGRYSGDEVLVNGTGLATPTFGP